MDYQTKAEVEDDPQKTVDGMRMILDGITEQEKTRGQYRLPVIFTHRITPGDRRDNYYPGYIESDLIPVKFRRRNNGIY